jgi:FMN reductase
MMILGLGGTTRPGSTTETAVRTALNVAEAHGAEVSFIGADRLQLPFYDLRSPDRTDHAKALVEAVRGADGLIIGSPGYHGAVSGLLKNALDYMEDLSEGDAPYLHAKPVGCITVAYGWQAAVSTLGNLRGIVHALRGWPTPYGAAMNATEGLFEDGRCVDPRAEASLRTVASQVVEFSTMSKAQVGHAMGTPPTEKEGSPEWL